MPHRTPGPSGSSSTTRHLSGDPIRYYRPRGSADVRRLVDEGFQAFNAGRLSEACHVFADKMLDPANDTTIGLTVAGALTPAGLGGCVIELMERGLVDFVISTGANLYHDLHYALNFTLHRGSPFLDDVELHEDGVIRIYDILFPAQVLLETDAYVRDFLARQSFDGPVSSAALHYALGQDLMSRYPGCEAHSVVASAAATGVPIYTSSPGDSSIGMNLAAHELLHGGGCTIDPNRDVNEVAAIILGGTRNGCLILGGGLAQELLFAGAADALGDLRYSEGRLRVFRPDHDRSGRVGWALGCLTVRGGQLGQGQPRYAARHRGRLLRLDDRLSDPL